MKRRQFNQAITAALAAPALASPLIAGAKPYSGTVRVLVGFPPGGATDVVARAIIEKLGPVMNGQVFVIDNKAGAGGQIAAQFLKSAPPDGSTIMLSIDHTQVIIPLTIAAAGYDPVKDFTPLVGVAEYYNVLAVSASIGVKTVAELGAWMKANPTKANYGVPAAGSVPQFIGYVIGQSFGVTMNSVPYKGGAPMVQDLLSGQIPIGVASMTELIEYHRAGKVRILASSGEVRSKSAPDVPTFREAGIQGIDKNPWLAFFGPKGMPEDFVEAFGKGVKTALSQPDLQERLAKMGNEVNPAPSKEVGQWVVDANRVWSKVIRDSGFKMQ
jgi:tripartite-type tricarboxylate transporter receptor subunit TctC